MTPEQREFYQAGYKAGLAAGRARRWSPKDEQVLLKWEGTDEELASHLKRTRMSIRMKRFKLRQMGAME